MDLQNFIAPVSNYEGLYKIGDDLQHQQDKKDAATKLAKGQSAATAKAIADFADPKEHLSGTPTDPEVIRRYGSLMDKGYKLAAAGADQNTILMSLNKDATDLNQYTQGTKVMNQSLEKQLTELPAGYDKNKIREYARQKAFYNSDGTVKSLQDVDPNADYVGQVIKDSPELVTDNSGVDNVLKGMRMVPFGKTLKMTNAKGGSEYKKVEGEAYPWAVPETDQTGLSNGTFVPQYEIAHDNQTPITHDFKGADGKITTAPVRMVPDGLYKSFLYNSPQTADYIRGQINLAIKSGDYKDANGKPISINSPQADMLGKTILYDELKSRGLGGMKETIEQKANPAPKVSVTVNNGKDGVEINKLYERISDKVDNGDVTTNEKSPTPGLKVTRMNQLNGDEQKAVFSQISGKYDNATDIPFNQDNTFLYKEPNGTIGVYKVDENGQPTVSVKNRLIGLNKIGTNIKVQAGAKDKRAVVAQGDNTHIKSKTKDPLGLF